MIPTVVFLYGLAIGSFLNVCIHRLPRGESIVRPRSRCPQCGHSIAAYDNIPLVSYLLLGGKCRHCRARISPLYFCVELTTGLLFLFLYTRYGLGGDFAKYAVFGALLLVLAVTDWQERLLPDRVTFPGMALGLGFSLLVPIADETVWLLVRWAGWEPLPLAVESLLESSLGALVGGGSLYVVGELYFRLRGREGMGLGDVKMMALVGFFLGPKLALLTIFLAALGGSLLGGIFILASRRGSQYELPFGSFLSVAAFAAALWGRPLLDWYLGYWG